MKLEIRKIGNSFGVILPKQLMENLHVKPGENLYVVEADNGVTLTPYDPDFEKIMDAYDELSQNYRNALKELANENSPVAKRISRKNLSGKASS